MSANDQKTTTKRRTFLGALATFFGAIGVSAYAKPSNLETYSSTFDGKESPADTWFKKVKGKHRVVFDATQPHEIYPFAWPRVFMITNGMTGTPESDCGVVVVLRHTAIGYAMEDKLWAKYGFGELFKADDPATKKPSKRNPFWQPKKGDFKIPGFGEVAIGINELQARGVMFCVCEAAITVYSTVAAGSMKKDADEVRKEWMAGLLPGIQVVPSGVWALGRAQEKGCQYIFAG